MDPVGHGDMRVLGLHGSPRINRQLTTGLSTVEVRAVRERVVRRQRRGRLNIPETTYRLEGVLRHFAIGRGPHLGLLSDIAGEWLLEPRTAATGETGGALAVPVRTTSAVVAIAARGRIRSRDGEPVAEVVVEWRSLLTYTAEEIGLSKQVA